MNKVLMSAETKAKILENSFINIDQTIKAIDEVISLIKQTDAISSFLTEKNKNFEFSNILHLMEYKMFIE